MGRCNRCATIPAMVDPDNLDLHARREALAFTASQGRMSVAPLWSVYLVVGWLAHGAGARASLALFAGVALLIGVLRLALLPREQALQRMDLAALQRVERRVLWMAALSGVNWAFATAAFYPMMDAGTGAIFLVILVGNISAAAFLFSTVRHAYALMAVPAVAGLCQVSLARGDRASMGMVLLALIYLVMMISASHRLRHATWLSIRREHEARQTALELRTAMREAQAAGDAKTRFLATMSHELRTPMTGLLGALDLLARTPHSPPQLRLIEIARKSGKGLLAVLDDVLDYARINADGLTLRPQSADLRALVDSVVALFEAPAHAKGLALQREVTEAVPRWALADAQRLRQVLLNLVGNAIKFTEAGQVVLRVDRVADGVRFEVFDSGMGMAPEAVEGLFQPFRQVHGGNQRVHGGTGLGLAISQRLVQAMGSRIEVRSTPGAGSCFAFSVDLPKCTAPPATTPPSAVLTLPIGRSARVLLAEDNEVNRLLAVKLLHLLAVQVEVAVDGQQALDRLQQGGIDLVLMDCQMPKLDGTEATRRWRAIERERRLPRVPVVAMTASVMADDLAPMREAGMDDLLGKPYSFEQLREMLLRWLPPPVAAPAQPGRAATTAARADAAQGPG